MKIQSRITLTSIALVALTIAAIVMTTLFQKIKLERVVTSELDKLTREQAASIARDAHRLAASTHQATEETLRRDRSFALRLLREKGGVRTDPAAARVPWSAVEEASNRDLTVSLPPFYVGSARIGPNFDPGVPTPLVDEILEMEGALCALYQRTNAAGDMIRVATTVLDAKGKRAVGSVSPAPPEVLGGQSYVGLTVAAGEQHLASYDPLTDDSGEVVGMLVVSTPLDRSGVVRRAILETVVGETGYMFVLSGSGAARGTYLISQNGSRDGENIWEAKDAQGRAFIQSIIAKALATKDGAVDFERYPWLNAGDKAARWKLTAVTYFEPWDWVIGAGAYEEELQSALIRVSQPVQDLLRWTVAVAAVVLVVAAVASLLIARGIARPIARATGAAAQMALGDFGISLEHHSSDEVGEMVSAFRSMAEAQSRKAELAQRIAEGDLTNEVVLASDRDTLGSALGEMTRNLGHVLGQVQGASSLVSMAAEQVSQASQALSQGATEQASSMEEISSALTQVSSQAKHNAESAGEANALAKAAALDAGRGDEQMRALVGVMGRIESATGDIRKVVKLIDDIAFQINLLALNANVEAARAGKYGKGFAVVAEAVRGLAVRSAGAVKETSAMVDAATQGIGEGARSAAEAAAQLGRIVHGITKVADVLAEIEQASKEQATGVEQISAGIDQVDHVTQANTASAEQSAAAAEELSSQAQELKALAMRFQLKGGVAAGIAAGIEPLPAGGISSLSGAPGAN